MNIWLTQINETLPLRAGARRMRTGHLAAALLQRGHRVVWWGSTFNHLTKQTIAASECEVAAPGGLRLRLMKGMPYHGNVSLRRFVSHRLTAKRFSRLARAESPPDVIIASSPSYDLAFEAVRYGSERSVPVLLDIRDPWPDLFVDQTPGFLRAGARFLLEHEFALMRSACSGAASLIAASSYLLDFGLKYAQRPRGLRDAVFYLGSDARPAAPKGCVNSELFERCRGKFVVLFIGTLSVYHDPSDVIAAARLLQDQPILFVIAGDGERGAAIRQRSSGLSNVAMPGWLDQAEMDQLLAVASAGVCTTLKDVPLFPNKAFLYMSAGLPVISAFKGELRNLIESGDIGLCCEPGDPQGLARSVMTLYRDPETHAQMSANALRLFHRSFRSDDIYQDYAAHVERFGETGCASRGVRSELSRCAIEK